MSSGGFRRRMDLNPAQREELHAQLSAGTSQTDASKRINTRHDYQVADIPLCILHPEGGESRFLVYGRNLSRSGMGVLHGGFVHSGSKVQVAFKQATGGHIAVAGEVVHCRLIAGSCHEVGIRFDQEIDPTSIVGCVATDPETATGAAASPERLQSSILVVDAFDPDRALLEHQLTTYGAEVVAASAAGQALDAARKQDFDAAIIGLAESQDAIHAIKGVRQERPKLPILLLAADTDPAWLQKARAAGVSAVISRPHSLDSVVAHLQSHAQSTAPAGQIHSTVLQMPGMRPLVQQFITALRRDLMPLEKAVETSDLETIRRHCLQLQGSGSCFGFQQLTASALAVVAAMDQKRDQATRDASIAHLLAVARAITGTASAKAA